MMNSYGYFHFLKFHILILCLPALFVGIAFFNSLILFANDLYFLYRILAGQGGELGTWGIVLFVGKKIMKYGFMVMLLSVLIQIFKSGLYFLPFLAWKNELTIRGVLRVGTRRLFHIFMIVFGMNILFGILSSIIALIPFINLISFIVFPVLTAISSILFDYLFSINLQAGKPLLSQVSLRFQELFVSDKRFIGYAVLLTLSYFFLASAFVKPFIQKEIYARFSNPPEYPRYSNRIA